MRINIYNAHLDEDNHPVLVKEKSLNYGDSLYFNSPPRIVDVMNKVFQMNQLAEEHVYMVALNTKCKPLGFFLVSKGTVNHSILCPREIMIRNLLIGAVNFIMVHNHPSQDATASREDVTVTKRLKEVGSLLGITLLDHIIIAGDSYFSFKEKDML